VNCPAASCLENGQAADRHQDRLNEQAGIATLGWDVSPDGKRFLFPIPLAAGESTPPLRVVLNWTSLLPH